MDRIFWYRAFPRPTAHLGGLAGLLALLLLCVPSLACARTEERLAIINNHSRIGTLVAVTEGDSVAIDFAFSNNGRGPKLRATARMDAQGLPLAWAVEGQSLLGAAVAERYDWKDGRATWESQADRGEAAAPRPGLYMVNDDSPWVLGVYARALLKAPGNRLDLLPGGSLTLTKAASMRFGGGRSAVPVDVYRLSGLHLVSDYVMLDRQGRMFASLTQSQQPALLTVREGYETLAAQVKDGIAALEMERARDMKARLGHAFEGPVRIRNVRVFDPRSGTLSDPTSVVVHQGRISRIGTHAGDAGPDAGGATIDGEGGTLIPGLADMHAHHYLDTGPLQIAGGITTARDMGNDNGFMQDLVRRIDAGDLIGPHIVLNGFIEGKSPFSARGGRVVDSVEAALDAVRWYADRGYWRVKIYNSMKPEWVGPVAAEAHRLGMGVSGHIPAFARPDDMIEAGYDELTHINQLVLGWVLKPGEDTRTPLRLTAMSRAAGLDLSSAPVRHTVDLMKTHRTDFDPTISIFEMLMLSRSGEVPPGEIDYFDHMPFGFQRVEKRSYVKLASAAEDQAYHKGFETMLAVLKMLHDAGIRFLPGTDLSNGFTLHRELELYVRAGLTPAQALRTATLDVAEYLGRTGDSGTIERGKRADMLLVAGDPTRDIKALKAVRMVLKDGTVYFPSEIYREVGIKPFTTPPPLTRGAGAGGRP